MRRKRKPCRSGEMSIAFVREALRTGALPKVWCEPMWKGRPLFKRPKLGKWEVNDKYGTQRCVASYQCKRKLKGFDGIRVTLETGHWMRGMFLVPCRLLPARSTISAAWDMGMSSIVVTERDDG